MNYKIDTLFSNLGTFRHLPNYQLERRADIFFSLYLTEALSAKTGEKITKEFIPEFPVRIGSIYPSIPINKSFKIDYVCFSGDLKKAFLVELKTDQGSINEKQLRYLKASKNAGIQTLVEGVIDIFRATTAKRKYFILLELIEKIGLISIPDKMKEKISQDSLRGITGLVNDIDVHWKFDACSIVYISPEKINNSLIDFSIDFQEFSKTVSKHKDEVSKRFVESLLEWKKNEAGKY